MKFYSYLFFLYKHINDDYMSGPDWMYPSTNYPAPTVQW